MQNLMDRRALSSRLAQRPNESPFPQIRLAVQEGRNLCANKRVQ